MDHTQSYGSRKWSEGGTVQRQTQRWLVAQDVVALREARGLSQRQLAEQLGVTQSAIAQLESAKLRNLELLTLVRAATALGGRVDVKSWSDG